MTIITRTEIDFEDSRLSLLKYWMKDYYNVEMFDSSDFLSIRGINDVQIREGDDYTVDGNFFKHAFHFVEYGDDYDKIVRLLDLTANKEDTKTHLGFIGEYHFKIKSVKHKIKEIEENDYLWEFENLDNIEDFISFMENGTTEIIIINTKITLSK